jgi:glycosyltransferase involved in cell wall biosynthesis
MEKLVSILTPCYNGEKHIWRLLDSILKQTYPRIEMFVVDDGSTDNSADVIKSYIPRFEAKGYLLTYVYQDNSGQSVAINNGLKMIKGDYLVWPDCDDFYAEKNAIQELVNVLDNSNETVSMVRCQSNILDADTLKTTGQFCVNNHVGEKTDLFEDCLFSQNAYWYVPGDYMAKTKKIDELIPDREIYTEKKAGQNWQLMLPLLHKHQCITIEKFLYNVWGREDSHSRSNQYSALERYEFYENTLLDTIDRITTLTVEQKEKYKRLIKKAYRKKRLIIFLRKCHLYAFIRK